MPEGPFVKVGRGSVGGKGAGLASLWEAVGRITGYEANRACAGLLRLPRTVMVASDVFAAFVEENGLAARCRDVEEAEGRGYEELRDAFLAGRFPEELAEAVFSLVRGVGGPLVVRSSSELEDRKGAAFAGKYESVFVGNQGTEEERRSRLLDAVKAVYASTYNPSAVTYRSKHGFAPGTESMPCLVQEVVGRAWRDLYLPALAGVGFSQNGYCWSKEVHRRDGLVRLVMGLGTRAVGRGYVRLFCPAKPLLRPEGTEVNNIQKCSQKKVDVISRKEGGLTSVHFRELVGDGFDCVPGADAFVSLRDGNHLYRPVSRLWDAAHVPVLTLDGVLSGRWMGLELAPTMGWLLHELERELGWPVDLEFAIDVDPEDRRASIVLLQARPLSMGAAGAPRVIPTVPREDVLFAVRRSLPTAHVPDIEYVVYVDDDAYRGWPPGDRHSVARAVGKLGEALQGRRFALVGPGRWGSWNPQLGVPVSYAEISRSAMLVEIARRRATYVPEVSFGSHFFQDLIEDRIAYLPLHPDEPGETFNEEWFRGPSSLEAMLPDPYFRRFDGLIRVIHVPSVAGGRRAHAILDGDLEQAIVYVA